MRPLNGPTATSGRAFSRHNMIGLERATNGAAHNAHVIATNGEISTSDPSRDHFHTPSPRSRRLAPTTAFTSPACNDSSHNQRNDPSATAVTKRVDASVASRDFRSRNLPANSTAGPDGSRTQNFGR